MLTKPFILLAELDRELQDTRPSKGFNLSLRDTLLVVGVGLGLALILFLWVYLARQRRRGHSLARSSISSDHPDREMSHSSPGKVKYRKKRRRHPDHLPRNPSLGETGGLPPPRSEDAAGPQS